MNGDFVYCSTVNTHMPWAILFGNKVGWNYNVPTFTKRENFTAHMCLTYPSSPLLILQNISLFFGLLVKGCLHFLFHFTKHTNTHFFLTFSLTTPLLHTLHHHLHHLFPTRSLENSFGTTKHLHIFYLR